MKDPIVEEVRRIREEIFAKYDYDLRRMTEAERHRWRDWPGGIIPAPEEQNPKR